MTKFMTGAYIRFW